MSNAHASHEHGHAHSHKKAYIRLGILLTFITLVELALPLLKDHAPELWDMFKPVWGPALVIMSVFKFGAVVGEFMHLREDRAIYKFLFISPLLMATACFLVLGLFSMVVYKPFGEGYAITQADLKAGYVPPSKLAADPVWADDKLQAAFAEYEAKGHTEAKKLFGEKCASCHGPEGAGMPNLGVNLTDNCYKHGGKISDTYNVLVAGVSGTAMPQWASVLKGEELRQMSYYVRSMRGQNKAGRPCEGDPAKD